MSSGTSFDELEIFIDAAEGGFITTNVFKVGITSPCR